MKYKIKLILILILILCIIFQNVYCLAYYIGEDTEYVWSETAVETAASGGEAGDFLNLTCESAILIEQTTRYNSL